MLSVLNFYMYKFSGSPIDEKFLYFSNFLFVDI